MRGFVDIRFVDAEETENEKSPDGERISEGIDCGIKETKLN